MADGTPAASPPTARSYSAHLDTLTALITYLALTHHKSRTAGGLAAALGLPLDEVQATFDECPAMFRRRVSASGETYYTLHARYALRPYDSADDDEVPEVRPNILEVLLAFVSQQAREERESERFATELASTEANSRRAANNARWATLVSLVAAALAFVGVVVGVTTGT